MPAKTTQFKTKRIAPLTYMNSMSSRDEVPPYVNPAIPEKFDYVLGGKWPFKAGSMALAAFRVVLEKKVTKAELKEMIEAQGFALPPVWTKLKAGKSATHTWTLATGSKGILSIEDLLVTLEKVKDATDIRIS